MERSTLYILVLRISVEAIGTESKFYRTKSNIESLSTSSHDGVEYLPQGHEQIGERV